MRVLVTGGAGYIGSFAVRHLIERGHEVTVYDSLSFGHKTAVPEASLVVGDLKDTDRLDQLFMSKRVEAVMHFAASTMVGESVAEPAKYYRNNTLHGLNLLELCRHHGVRRFVFSSTAATFGVPETMPIGPETPQRPINPYGRSKLMTEMMLDDYRAAYGLGFAALRYFNAAGAARDGSMGEDHTPETHLIPLALKAIQGKTPPLVVFGTDYPTPDGTCIRDYVHVEDLATAHALALEKLSPGVALKLNLGIGEGYSIRQVLDTAGRVAGKEVPHTTGPRRAGDPAELVADPSAAMRELGWKPRYLDLEAIVETAWSWHSSHPDGYGR